MTMLPEPRPGVWGKDAKVGEVIRILKDGTPVVNVGAAFFTLTGGKDMRLRRELGYD